MDAARWRSPRPFRTSPTRGWSALIFQELNLRQFEIQDGYFTEVCCLCHLWPAQLLRSTGNGLRSRIGSAVGADPVMIPVVAPPGERGAFTLPGALEDYLGIAGPTWRNEVDASVVMELGKARVGSSARQVRCRSPTVRRDPRA